MITRYNISLLFIFLFMTASPIFAQNGMEEYFYESGKIKVVIGVAAIVLIGLLIYLWRLDPRVTQLENKKKGGKS
jgi:CcmD family protein